MSVVDYVEHGRVDYLYKLSLSIVVCMLLLNVT
jgi:hypothetical protein